MKQSFLTRWQLGANFRLLLLAGLAALVALCFLVFGRELTPDTSANHPYAYEITAAFLGTLLTITITAILLRYQSAGEIGKERSVTIYGAKLKTYESLLERIEGILADEKLDDAEFFALQLAFQKVVYIAGPRVLQELPSVASVFASIPRNTSISAPAHLNILHAFGRLAGEIRADLSTTEEAEETPDIERLLMQIEANFYPTAPKNGGKELFDHAQQFLKANNLAHEISAAGIFVFNVKNRMVLHLHPLCEMPNKIFPHHLTAKQQEAVEKLIDGKRISRWAFRTQDLSCAEIQDLIFQLATTKS